MSALFRRSVSSQLLSSLQFILHFTRSFFRSVSLLPYVGLIFHSRYHICSYSFMKNDSMTIFSVAHFTFYFQSTFFYHYPPRSKRGIRENKMDHSTAQIGRFPLTSNTRNVSVTSLELSNLSCDFTLTPSSTAINHTTVFFQWEQDGAFDCSSQTFLSNFLL